MQTGAIPIAIGINNAGVKEKYDKLIEDYAYKNVGGQPDEVGK